MALERIAQFSRPQQAADMVRSKRRIGREGHVLLPIKF
jgi:hypothetical protein